MELFLFCIVARLECILPFDNIRVLSSIELILRAVSDVEFISSRFFVDSTLNLAKYIIKIILFKIEGNHETN